MDTMDATELKALREAILGWYDARARALPWRGTRDPYAVWVSEIMLQQTRAEAVIPYYFAFMRDYPDVRTLAQAELSDVLKHWEGLGYYSRARNLHKAAQTVAFLMDGEFPKDARGLGALSGVGEYTAGMIASIAYGHAEPAIDGNQIRVLSRVFEVDEPARSRQGAARIRACARALLSEQRPGDFNQALMDIGSSICKPRRAGCGACPARAFCLARRSGAPERLPILPAKTEKRTERRGVAVVTADGKVLVTRRPERGLLGGLWVFPSFVDATSARALKACLGELGVSARPAMRLADVRHVFTHLIWEQRGWLLRAGEQTDVPGMRWVDAAGLKSLAMPAAVFAYRGAALEALGDTLGGTDR